MMQKSANEEEIKGKNDKYCIAYVRFTWGYKFGFIIQGTFHPTVEFLRS